MGVNAVVGRRFAELDAKADGVARAVTADEYGIRHAPGDLFHGWATNVQSLFANVFGTSSVQYVNFAKCVDNFNYYESSFLTARAVFDAAREDYEGGYLFRVEGLAKAEALADALSQAGELMAAGYKDPACVLARVALEVTLKQLCDQQELPHGKLDKMNANLCKAGVYNMAKQKQITAWADIGNKAAHGDWTTYDATDAKLMLDGVQTFVGDSL